MQGTNNAVTNGLVFMYDMNNPKSWKGAPTTNMLSLDNAYPTASNGWGTYNTNQYNSNVYWTWGTVGSVTNNIVTFSAVNRTVYSYDVINPQTTGGGLTAGTSYIVRRINSTQFSIHSYSSSQNGASGYTVHDTLNDDNRVAINATSFPTMWHGNAHLPNAGLVKEIIPNGFNFNGRVHDCIRLNYGHRAAGGGLDGMAYGGGSPTVTAGVTYTASFYRRATDDRAVGRNPSMSLYSGGGWSISSSTVPPLTREWQRCIYRGTPPGTAGTNFYWWPDGAYTYEIAEIQLEQQTHASGFVIGTRSNTEALLDLTGNNTITATSLTYNDDGSFEFVNASNNYMTAAGNGFVDGMTAYTITHWSRRDVESKMPIAGRLNSNFYHYGDNSWRYVHGGVGGEYYYPKSVSIPLGTWGFYCIVYDGANVKIYRNGVFEGQQATTGTANWLQGMKIGGWVSGDSYAYDGKIGSVSMYNRALTADEVKQNFNALRGRYGI